MGVRRFVKPVEIEAVQFTGDNAEEIAEWVGVEFSAIVANTTARWSLGTSLTLHMGDGSNWNLHPGDWVIKDADRFFWCHALDFAYEPAPDPSGLPEGDR